MRKLSSSNTFSPSKISANLAWKLLLIGGAVLSIIPLVSIFTNLQEFEAKIFFVISKSVLLRYISNTLVVIVLVVMLAIVLGSSIAWLTAVYKFPLRRLLIFLQLLPLLMPSYISAITWKDAFSPQSTVMKYISGLFSNSPIAVPNFYILVLVLVCNMYPYIFLVLYVLFSNMSQSLIDAARSINSKHYNLFLRIGLPLAKTSLIGTSLLVVMELLNSYWVYEYLGYDIITTGIVRVWRLYGNLAIAKILSVFVIVSVMLLVFFKNKIEQRQHKNPSTYSNCIIPITLPLAKQLAAMLWCVLPIVLGFIVPLAQLLVWAVPIVHTNTLSYAILPLVGNTLLVCVVVVACLIPLAVLNNYALKVCKGTLFRHCYSILTLGYAVPSVIVAILVFSAIRWLDVFIPNASMFALLINSGIYALSAACIYRYIPVALTSIGVGFNHTNAKYEDAARSLGSSHIRTLFTICIPINNRFIITATMLTIIDIIKEIPIVSLLHPYNFNTLALQMYYLVHDEQIGQSSIAALLILLAGILITLPIYIKLITKGEGRAKYHY